MGTPQQRMGPLLKTGGKMKKILLVLLMGSLAQAQIVKETSKETSTGDISSGPSNSTSVGSASGSNTASLETSIQTAKPFTFKIISENGATIGSLKDNSEGGFSQNSFGLGYKINDSHAVEVRAITFTEFNKTAEDKISKSHITNMADPTIHYNYTSSLSLLGSEKMVFANRYYVPVSKSSVEKKSNGVIRSQTGLEWSLNPRVSVGWEAQARLILNKPEAETSDAALRIFTGPKAAYNFNDKVSAYYTPYIETVSSNFSRGNFTADKANNLIHEAGMSIKVANIEINPAILTVTDGKGKSSYDGFGGDKNTEYDLNIVAVF